MQTENAKHCKQYAEIFNQLGLVNMILHDQLQVVVDENQSGGDLVSNTLSEILEDSTLPQHIRERLLPAFIRMQNKDIMHQQLTGVQTAFRLVLRQLKVAALNYEQGEERMPDIDGLFDQIYDTYVMQKQRQVHRKALGEEADDDASDGGLDFF